MMRNERQEQFEHELRDTGLAALLKDAYADDPALAEAPGRTDRIMRAVLASGHRPAPRPSFIWAPLGWAFGGIATAALAVVLTLNMASQTTNYSVAEVPHKAPATAARVAVTPPPAPLATQEVALTVPSLPTPKEKPTQAWPTPPAPTKDVEPVPTNNVPVAPVTPLAAPTTPETPVYMASALYSAGKAAHAVGDFENAYEAYQASYETMPTPEALLASAKVLQQL